MAEMVSLEIPRLLFAAPQSGSGKTTVVCAVLRALLNRKLRVAAFKSGPDYIDPMFHSKVIGALVFDRKRECETPVSQKQQEH